MAKRRDLKQKTWRTFLAVHRLLLERVERELADAKVLPVESFNVLRCLSEAPKRSMRLSELADAVLLTRSGITRLADRLEKAGLLYRQDCPNDRRGAFAVLSDRGLAEMERTRGVHERVVERYFGSHLNDAEVETFNTVLERLQSALNSSAGFPS